MSRSMTKMIARLTLLPEFGLGMLNFKSLQETHLRLGPTRYGNALAASHSSKNGKSGLLERIPVI